MKLDKKKIFEEYLKEVDRLFQEDEFMTHMSPEQCVNTVCLIIENLYKNNNDIPGFIPVTQIMGNGELVTKYINYNNVVDFGMVNSITTIWFVGSIDNRISVIESEDKILNLIRENGTNK